MRKPLFALILLGGVFFTLGAAPSVASAANCSFGNNATYRGATPPPGSTNPYRLWYAATIYNCTDVSAVRWIAHPAGQPWQGWFDNSGGTWAQGYYGTSPDFFYSGDDQLNNPGGGVNTRYVVQDCWWYGHSRTLTTRWYAQIKRASTGTWGSVVTLGGIVTSLTC